MIGIRTALPGVQSLVIVEMKMEALNDQAEAQMQSRQITQDLRVKKSRITEEERRLIGLGKVGKKNDWSRIILLELSLTVWEKGRADLQLKHPEIQPEVKKKDLPF